MKFLFDPEPVRAAEVQGASAQYPVRRIFCVGRNYAEHAREMGGEVDREAPFYFTKSALALTPSGATVPYPPGTGDYHHEMEFVIALGAPAFRIATKDAPGVVFGYACGLDMTRRDLQAAAKEKRRPWDIGKDFEHSAVLGAITRAEDFGPVGPQAISLSVNRAPRQAARLADMVWSVAEIISHLSTLYHLGPGDLIYTGTPAGVGPVVPGDVLDGKIDGLGPLRLVIGAAE
ncbi:MAG: fumarylacetoacetase [Alphaproteobacteria bacterium HGW-Alphaproteobacteria-4]|nr:MAG: fumarylacetoacetase [Alphaproteobacteria bacterium HGW-Alphaproteobacteria-4]